MAATISGFALLNPKPESSAGHDGLLDEEIHRGTAKLRTAGQGPVDEYLMAKKTQEHSGNLTA